jgi:hypothetical protein
MSGDSLNTLLAISAGALAVLSLGVFLIAVCLPREKRSAVLRHLGRKWII